MDLRRGVNNTTFMHVRNPLCSTQIHELGCRKDRRWDLQFAVVSSFSSKSLENLIYRNQKICSVELMEYTEGETAFQLAHYDAHCACGQTRGTRMNSYM